MVWHVRHNACESSPCRVLPRLPGSSSLWSTQGSQLCAKRYVVGLRKNETCPVLINKNMLKYVSCANVGETFVVHLRQSGKVNVQGPACF